MSTQITEQQVREFIDYAAARLAYSTHSDRIFVGCSACIVGPMPTSVSWRISVDDLCHSFQGATYDDALASYAASKHPDSKRKMAESLRRQAQELESQAEAESVAPVAQ